MKKAKNAHIKGLICLGALIFVILLILNFILPLPALFPIIGDVDLWLRILSSGLFSIAAVGFRYLWEGKRKEKELKRQNIRDEISRLTKRYERAESIIIENISILNIETNLKNFLSQITASSTNYELIEKVSSYLQQIRDTQNKLETFYINEKRDSLKYRSTIKTIVHAYTIALDLLITDLNKRNSLQVSMSNADILSSHGSSADKLTFNIIKVRAIQEQQKGQNLLLSVLTEQKGNMNTFLRSIKEEAETLLKYENSKITEKNNELKELS